MNMEKHGKRQKHGKEEEAKNFYRKDAKYAKKEKQCLMLLSALSVFAVRMFLCLRTAVM